MSTELFLYVLVLLLLAETIVMEILHQRENNKLLDYFRERVDAMLAQYDSLMLKFIATSAVEKEKLFEIEKERIALEREAVEIRHDEVRNDGKRLTHINAPVVEQDKMEEALRELRKKSQDKINGRRVESAQDM